MESGLADKVAIVTGGASHIGRAIVLALAAEGAIVVIADLDEVQGRKVVEEVEQLGSAAMLVRTDATDWDQVHAATQSTLDQYNQIDILVNNVGAGFVPRLFTDEDPPTWKHILDLNFNSMAYFTRAALDHMVPKRSGAIVSLGSDAGRTFQPKAGLYGSAKAAVISLTRTLAFEVGPYGIRLNVVCPALTPARPEEVGELSNWRMPENQALSRDEAREKAAKRYPLRKLGKPEDIANAVVFLASDRLAGHITGQTLSVNGGVTLI